MWKIRMLVSKNPRTLILILLDELELMNTVTYVQTGGRFLHFQTQEPSPCHSKTALLNVY
jgi:hypothetical protein